MPRDHFANAAVASAARSDEPVMRIENPRRALLGVTQALVALLRDQQSPRIVMVSGLEGGEGATTVSWNLARAVAREFAGQVCLIRLEETAPPPSARAPEAGSVDGVFDAILSRRDLAAALSEGLRANLPRISADPLLYVIDGPPLLDSLEAYRLCEQVDGLVIVAAAESTTGAALDAARAVVAGARCRLIGAVLNKRRSRLPAFLVNLFGGVFRPRVTPTAPERPSGRLT